MAEATKKAFVTGHPIKHSRSPKIHGHWLAQHGIDQGWINHNKMRETGRIKYEMHYGHR